MGTLLEVVWKSVLAFLVLVIISRVLGRKFLDRMTTFDFAVSIVIGTITGAYVTKDLHGYWILLSPAVISLAALGTAELTLKSLPARKIIEGEPVVVIQNGKILENNLRRLRYNLNDLEMQLRDRDIFDISELEFAVLEPHGKLSVLKKSQHQPVTPQDLGLPTRYRGLASEIIKDGEIIEQNLRQNNLSFAWLYDELRRRGIEKVSEVVYASLQADGTLYTDLRDDRLGYVQKVEDKA
ncbi:MAG: DUF421 domain-containing protein [Syntrophomonadaceae bacterium]|nr:DUF421 domain-containing protein [Syntrophomonadaceae bacterium]